MQTSPFGKLIICQTHIGFNACTIVGAGPGLTTAIRLLENGHEVEIISDSSVPRLFQTWPLQSGTFLVKPADGQIWGIETYKVLERMCTEAPESGVRMRDGEYLRTLRICLLEMRT